MLTAGVGKRFQHIINIGDDKRKVEWLIVEAKFKRFYSATRLTVATQQAFTCDNLRVNTSSQQPMQRYSTYNCANFARRRDYPSNSHILIVGQFVKNFVGWPR